ncbi:hypothetical protein [Actinomycetospora sp. CA-084318]|uniref:hypothetical protein n=1 Tax=Actinomycetospora sp. CA-084318 TaxID=3239892 RepID=UPI003D9A0963
MKKILSTLAVTLSIAAATLSASLVNTPAAHAGCDWRYNVWCVPPAPRLELRAPSWPDPRPPLAAKNSAWCTQGFIYASEYSGWARVDADKVNKRMWPDYYHYGYVYVVAYRGTWVQPDHDRGYTTVDCDA